MVRHTGGFAGGTTFQLIKIYLKMYRCFPYLNEAQVNTDGATSQLVKICLTMYRCFCHLNEAQANTGGKNLFKDVQVFSLSK